MTEPAAGADVPKNALQRLWREVLRRTQRRPALANVLRMLAGNVLAQVLTLAAYPVLTRLYTPGQMGVLSALMAAVTILAPMAALSLELALPLARTRREASSMLAASGLALVSTTLLATLLMAALPGPWPGRMAAEAPYRWFLPLALLGFGGYAILVNEAARRDRFGEIARSRVMQAVSGPALQIGTGWLGFGPVGLLSGYVIGQSSGALGLALRLLRGPQAALARISWASVRAGVHRHRNFVLYSSWTSVVSAATTSAMTIAFAFIYGPAISGFMFLGERVLMRPLMLVGTSIQPVYTRRMALLLEREPARLPALFVSVAAKQALLSLLWIVPIVIAAPRLLPVVFGDAWAESALFVQVLAIGYLPIAVLQPVQHTLQILGQQKLSAVLDVLRSVAVFAAIAAVAGSDLSPLRAALVCSVVQAAAQTMVLVFTWRRVRRVAAAVR